MYKDLRFIRANSSHARLIQETCLVASIEHSSRFLGKIHPVSLKRASETVGTVALSIARQPHYLAVCDGFASENPLFTANNKQVCGFVAIKKHPVSGHRVIDRLYCPKSPYPTGSIFMEMIVANAKSAGFEAIEVTPGHQKADDWYRKRALFQDKPPTPPEKQMLRSYFTRQRF